MIHAVNPLRNIPEKVTHFQDQLVTVADLQKFHEQLLKDMRKLLARTASVPERPWLKSGEVRKLLNISLGTLQTLRSNGTLRYNKVGGTIYYDYKDIQVMMGNSL